MYEMLYVKQNFVIISNMNMEKNESLAVIENAELILPGTKQEARILEIVDNFRRQNRRQFRESWLGEKLNRFLFGKDYEEKDQEGWPEKGHWNFALADYLWTLSCEADWWRGKLNEEEFDGFDMDYWIKKSEDGRFYLCERMGYLLGLNPDGSALLQKTDLNALDSKKLAEFVQNDARKLRQLHIEAIVIHLYRDYLQAPLERKQCVQRDLLSGLPEALSSFGIILEAMPNIPVYNGQEPGIVFQNGCAYRIAFQNFNRRIELTAYCLGYVNGEPFFELDAYALPFVTQHYLGQQGFVGLTISGKPVFATEDGELYTKAAQYIAAAAGAY